MVKKLLCGAFAMVLALTSLAGCKQNGNASSSSIEEAPASLAPKDELMDYDKYTMEAYLKPYWYTREVYNETIMFVGAEDEARLMYDASEIISVRNYYLDTEYYEGVDWTYENGVFRRTEKSVIPYWNVEEYYTTEPGRFSIGVDKNKIQYELEGKRYLKYAEGNAFTCKQIAITYRHDMPWEGPVPVGKSQRFSKTLQKIKNGDVTNILLFGDSISTGCNASGMPQGGNTPPHMPPFDKLVGDYLTDKYDANVAIVNTSEGGMDVHWARDNVQSRVIDKNPDLAIIAFGMNDASKTTNAFNTALRIMINRIHAALPETEIMLIGTMLPNYEADANWYGNQQYFARDMLVLEDEYSFVSVADVTQMHKAMFDAGKRYRDVTGNNINHPNDFVVRLYAQVILKTLLGNEFCNERYVRQ